MIDDNSPLITVDELCEQLMISKGAAYQLLQSGKVKCFRINKIWKIPREAVQEYIQVQCENHKKAAEQSFFVPVFQTFQGYPYSYGNANIVRYIYILL